MPVLRVAAQRVAVQRAAAQRAAVVSSPRRSPAAAGAACGRSPVAAGVTAVRASGRAPPGPRARRALLSECRRICRKRLCPGSRRHRWDSSQGPPSRTTSRLRVPYYRARCRAHQCEYGASGSRGAVREGRRSGWRVLRPGASPG